MSEVNYSQLYKIQDKVFSYFKGIDGPFYLSGGTALGRFYLNHRYSADLDLFVNASTHFKDDVKPYEKALRDNFSVQKEGSLITDEFIRFLILDESLSLKVEFVNDVKFRYKSAIQSDVFPVDNIRNILSNKLTCIISRDEPKDFYDILHIALNYSFNWKEIVIEALEKAFFNEIDLSERIASFPVEWLVNVDWIKDEPDISRIKIFQDKIATEILFATDNTLCGINKQLDEIMPVRNKLFS